MRKIYVTIEGKNSAELAEHFKDWFESEGEFKFLDYVDKVDYNLDYDGVAIYVNK